MTPAQLAWAVRSLMVVTAAVCAYLQVQTEVTFDPWVNLVIGALLVGLAALNPSTVANKLSGGGA
jgi:hypothetical protein